MWLTVWVDNSSLVNVIRSSGRKVSWKRELWMLAAMDASSVYDTTVWVSFWLPAQLLSARGLECFTPITVKLLPHWLVRVLIFERERFLLLVLQFRLGQQGRTLEISNHHYSFLQRNKMYIPEVTCEGHAVSERQDLGIVHTFSPRATWPPGGGVTGACLTSLQPFSPLDWFSAPSDGVGCVQKHRKKEWETLSHVYSGPLDLKAEAWISARQGREGLCRQRRQPSLFLLFQQLLPSQLVLWYPLCMTMLGGGPQR